jgi:hypothetical protein
MGIAENEQVVRNFYEAAARGDMELTVQECRNAETGTESDL